MLKRISYRLNTALENWLPEQRLYLKSETKTRYVRIRPMTQLAALAGSVSIIGWAMVASAVVLMDGISTGSGKMATARQQAIYESRLNSLSDDRDARAQEAVNAQQRFSLALDEVSAMQSRLLASEDQRRELESGLSAVQDVLRKTLAERDAARDQARTVTAALADDDQADGVEATDTLQMMTEALDATARQRDDMALAASKAEEAGADIENAKAALEARNDAIFTQLEDAVEMSMEPLDKMFRAAGLNTEDLLREVRRGYSGQGGPLNPVSLSTMSGEITPEEQRANSILEGLQKMNMYRIAAMHVPLAMPLDAAFRYSSPFGYRNDPKGAGRRFHSGVDLAAPIGTDIHVTGDGVVLRAGWVSGYGRLIEVQHDFGIVTRYGHLSRIRVQVGDKVSRGDIIGDMGSSGRSTGSHLHYEVRVGGQPVNPMTFIKAGNDVF
ncbi:M23 family metallopeptidase [Falsirhodobacter sp. alg1]|uniref:M23 family metallopeptidase n=1 Tax=Falsirhodobacter sp. alg1 TaxID=1472418 RepID=UPI0005ED9932|nr:M23 family metallopeptidase [Falsirhodobacter sp. alg1]